MIAEGGNGDREGNVCSGDVGETADIGVDNSSRHPEVQRH